METINISGLRVWAYHGVLEQERLTGNMFELNIALQADLSRAMESDCVDDTVNYAAIVAVAQEVMETPSSLLENVVWRLRNRIVHTFPAITGGSIKLTKLSPPIAASLDGVSVTTCW